MPAKQTPKKTAKKIAKKIPAKAVAKLPAKAPVKKSVAKTAAKKTAVKTPAPANVRAAKKTTPAPAKAPGKKAPAQVTSRLPVPSVLPVSAFPKAHAQVENLQPLVENGLYPAKSVLGETVRVTADIFRDGHEKCEADLLYRRSGETAWQRSTMRFVDNDAWAGEFTPDTLGPWEFTIEARTFPRPGYEAYAPFEQPYVHPHFGMLRVDPKLAEFSAWYEMFPRSQGTDPNAGATFADMEKRLPYIKDLGFDVLYLTPIHPIGETKRKGRNNSVTSQPGEPGSPYAIGNYRLAGKGGDGGHKAVHPEFGSLADCKRFFDVVRAQGMEIVLDYALNCSPDHPWVKKHPDWFYREPDGTIKCAENPPKRYEDIYPLNFFCADRENLWNELKSVIDFWIDMGVTVFRVDNPHTKPFGFWEWMIAAVKAAHPEVVFLAEAFTRPKIMKRLAKVGFDLSYTYFTWRVTAAELREYCEELTQQEPAQYMKPIFFATTPDILPWHLQNAPREMFKIRHALAATLVGAYGMYNSYELCEGEPYPGKEEFNNSEKYQYKVWDWDRPGNIKDFIRRLNKIRNDHPSLQQLKNLRFHESDNPELLVYSKADTEGGSGDVLLFIVNLDPRNAQSGFVTLDRKALGTEDEPIFGVHDLLSGESYAWSDHNYVQLDPFKEVLHVLKVEKF